MLRAKFDQQIVMQFHTFLMGEFHDPSRLVGKDETINIELINGGFAYHRNNQSVRLSVSTDAVVGAFTLSLYNGDILTKVFHFSAVMFYEARNVFLDWLLYERIDHTQAELKWKKRITSMLDDKPYNEVDVVVHISSSLETTALYNKFKDAGWTYVQDTGGYLHTIGHHGDMPVCVSPMVHIINGVKVMYVEATSMVVDWQMVEQWTAERCTKPNLVTETNPINLMGTIRAKAHDLKEVVG